MLQKKYFVTGGQGLLGRAVVRQLAARNIDAIAPGRGDLDLLSREAVEDFIAREQPTHVIHLASKVYGLQGNLRNQFSSLSYNTSVNDAIFNAIMGSSVKKVFFAGTVASYPFPYAVLPLSEEHLFNGMPHWGEYGYATSKLHAFHYLSIMHKVHQIDYVYGLLTNLYGPNDKFDTANGHVIPSLIRKAHDANLAGAALEVWGRPDVTRDFLFVEDAAAAIIHLCETGSGIYNIASGQETTMDMLSEEIRRAASISKPVQWRSEMPVGIPARSVNVAKLAASGFLPRYGLSEGIRITYEWYRSNINSARVS